MAFKKKSSGELNVIRVTRERVTLCVKGVTPLIICRMSEKAKRELLLPKGGVTAGDKKTKLKHDPYAEFVSSPYTIEDDVAPTLLACLSVSFKHAIGAVAVDLPDAPAKAQIGRSTYVENELVPIYGMPQLMMSVVRNSGINRTPDIRTRCIIPKWAAYVSITYATPIISQDVIVNLLANAGIMNGVGDFRAQKGKGNYGTWEIVEENDPEFQEIIGVGRAQQLAAMDDPECYDEESREMYSWFEAEAKRRGFSLLRGKVS